MTDRIFVSNLSVHAHHGVFDAEKTLGQVFNLDIECEIDRQPKRDDELSNTVCYGEVCDMVKRISDANSFNLIETFAESISSQLLKSYPSIVSVGVTVRKPSAPLNHIVDHVGVSIRRTRDD